MKVEYIPSGIKVSHKGQCTWVQGRINDEIIENTKEYLYKKYGGRPFNIKRFLPKLKIIKPIEKHWDIDYRQWTKGFSIFGINFLTHYSFQKPNKYRISTKKPKPYKPFNVSVKWEKGEFESFLQSIRQ